MAVYKRHTKKEKPTRKWSSSMLPTSNQSSIQTNVIRSEKCKKALRFVEALSAKKAWVLLRKGTNEENIQIYIYIYKYSPRLIIISMKNKIYGRRN